MKLQTVSVATILLLVPSSSVFADEPSTASPTPPSSAPLPPNDAAAPVTPATANTDTDTGRASEGDTSTPFKSRFFVRASLGVGRGALFTGDLSVDSTRVPIGVGLGVRPKPRLFITAAELVVDPGSTEHGVSVPRISLGPRGGYMPVDRLHVDLGVHAAMHMLVRKSNTDDGFVPVNAVLWRMAVGADASAQFDVFEIADRHWINVGVRGDLDWVFKTTYRAASLNVGYACH